MASNISLITLGVADVAKATAFYERLGFVYCGETPTQRWMEARRPFWP